MRVNINDRDALLAISPTALAAYARTAGWERHEPYRVHSDAYVGEDLPEIIVPRTERLGDYASVVAGLIEVFAQVKRQDETSVYRSLVTADREHAPRPDVRLRGYVRLLTRGEEEEDGTIRLRAFVDQNQKQQSVTAFLERQDYERAVQAHKDRALVILAGDLERMGQRWRLLNPRLEGILQDDENDLDE